MVAFVGGAVGLKGPSASVALKSEEPSALGEQVGESLWGCWTVKPLLEMVSLSEM